jgi:hypothetical protein
MPVALVEGAGLKRRELQKTAAGYRRTNKAELTVDMFRPVADWPWPPPVPCEVHKPYCFVARFWGEFPAGPGHSERGWWLPLSPIDIPSWLPGRGRRIIEVQLGCMNTDLYGYGLWTVRKVELWVDGSKAYGSDNLPSKDYEWYDVKLAPNVRLSEGAKNLEVRLYTAAGGINLPGFKVTAHLAGPGGDPITVIGEYYTEEPPATADVVIRILDRYTSSPVKSAYVALKQGDVVVADGYTGSDGRALFKNIEESAYTLFVQKEGYHDYTGSIEVKPPKVERTVYLTPLPTKPFPWEWVAVGGLVMVGGGTLMALARRKPEERVVVVR